jgi:hypothetical protein
MDFIDKWMYKLTGRKIPVFQIVDVGENGIIKSLTLSKWIRRDNSLIESWTVKGAEISGNHEGLVTYTDESGLTQPAFAEYKGRTCNLYVKPRNAPNAEKVIGSGAMLDDIAEAMDMGKSMRNIIIGMFIGMAVYAMFIGPIFSAMAK